MELVLVLFLLYGVQCVGWLPRGAVLFQRPLRTWRDASGPGWCLRHPLPGRPSVVGSRLPVVEEDGRPVSLSFVVRVQGRHYIDPVATSAAHKGRGLGTDAVATSIRLLQRDGVDEVGAVITDGNVASERLFARFGFTRIDPWG